MPPAGGGEALGEGGRGPGELGRADDLEPGVELRDRFGVVWVIDLIVP